MRIVAVALVIALVAGCGVAAPAAPSAERPDRPSSLPSAAADASQPDTVLGGEAPPASPPPPTPAPTARPIATPLPAPVTPDPSLPPLEPFATNLYRRGDYVAQYTFEWCVGASIQMTLAMTETSDDMSRGRQQRLWEMARDTSFSPFGGANPIGWVATLNDLGVGPYTLVSEPTLESAVRRAAAAIVETGRPVGLVMWRGRHAWVMSGFEGLGDPRDRADFQVTGVRVQDPLYPHGSRVWGPSPRPNALVSLDVLGEQFVARTSGRVNLRVAPGYILVLPIASA